jgi:hypothetical protein
VTGLRATTHREPDATGRTPRPGTGEANPANGVASFVLGFSSAVSLGFGDLFTPDSEKFQILLNNGFAAIVWMAYHCGIDARDPGETSVD